MLCDFRSNAALEWQAVGQGWRSWALNGGLSTRRACSKGHTILGLAGIVTHNKQSHAGLNDDAGWPTLQFEQPIVTATGMDLSDLAW